MTNNRVSVSYKFALVLVALALSNSGCSSRHFDADAESAKLLRMDAVWADLASQGKDLEKVLSYWSDDATLYFPGQPVVKRKAALRAYVSQRTPRPGSRNIW